MSRLIDDSGTIHVVGYGRTHHAGTGDTDGNGHFYGFECVNTGDQPWPSAQLDAMARAAAALCRADGWTERSVIGHEE